MGKILARLAERTSHRARTSVGGRESCAALGRSLEASVGRTCATTWLPGGPGAERATEEKAVTSVGGMVPRFEGGWWAVISHEPESVHVNFARCKESSIHQKGTWSRRWVSSTTRHPVFGRASHLNGELPGPQRACVRAHWLAQLFAVRMWPLILVRLGEDAGPAFSQVANGVRRGTGTEEVPQTEATFTRVTFSDPPALFSRKNVKCLGRMADRWS